MAHTPKHARRSVATQQAGPPSSASNGAVASDTPATTAPTAGPSRPLHFPALDSIRAMAVAFVLFHHTWGLGGTPLLNPKIPFTGITVPLHFYLQGAGLGVDIFFVLSGFLLSLPWHRHVYNASPAVRLGSYLKRRLLRICPPYYGVLFLVVVLLTPTIIPWELVGTGPGLQRIIAHTLFMQQVLPMSADGFRVLGSLWTLTIEMIFYLALPVMVIPFLRKRWVVATPVAIVASVLYLWAARNSLGFIVDAAVDSMRRYQLTGPALRASWLSNQFPAFLGDFGLGITAANLCVLARSPRRPAIMKLLERELVCLLLSVGGFVLIFFALYLNGSQHWARVAYYGDHLITAVGTTMVIVAVTQASGPTTRLLGFAPFRWLGVIGYSVFLWHMPIIYVVARYPFLAGLSPKQQFLQLTYRVLAITIPLSVVYYHLVEKPFMKSRPALAPTAPSTAGSVTTGSSGSSGSSGSGDAAAAPLRAIDVTDRAEADALAEQAGDTEPFAPDPIGTEPIGVSSPGPADPPA